MRYATLKSEFIAAGRAGFSIVPRAVMGNQNETILVMERPAGSTKPYEYELIETDLKARETLDQTILPLEDQGFSPVSMFLHHKYIIVMEKAAQR